MIGKERHMVQIGSIHIEFMAFDVITWGRIFFFPSETMGTKNNVILAILVSIFSTTYGRIEEKEKT